VCGEKRLPLGEEQGQRAARCWALRTIATAGSASSGDLQLVQCGPHGGAPSGGSAARRFRKAGADLRAVPDARARTRSCRPPASPSHLQPRRRRSHSAQPRRGRRSKASGLGQRRVPDIDIPPGVTPGESRQQGARRGGGGGGLPGLGQAWRSAGAVPRGRQRAAQVAVEDGRGVRPGGPDQAPGDGEIRPPPGDGGSDLGGLRRVSVEQMAAVPRRLNRRRGSDARSPSRRNHPRRGPS